MRTFVLGTGSDRKFVVIEVQGRHMSVTHGRADGTTKKSEKELASESAAVSACDLLARELTGRGYSERLPETGDGVKKTKRPSAAAPKVQGKQPAAKPAPIARVVEEDEDDAPYLLDEPEDEAVESVAPLQRLASAPTPSPASGTDKPKAKKKKKKKKKQDGEKKDWTFILGSSAAGLLLVGMIGYIVAPFFAPTTIYGTWQGSRVEYEPSKPMTYTHYKLTLDQAKNASLTMQQELTSTGTFTTKGDQLVLHLKGDDPEDDPEDITFKYKLSGSTLELFDPIKGESLVKLIKLSTTDSIGGAGPGAESVAAAPTVKEGADPAADAKLAEAEFVSKDGAFALRPPKGWESKGGSRPDNTYSWAEFSNGSARIRIDADVTGALMNDITRPGANDPDSSYPPVASAHDQNKRKVAEAYEDYKESEGVAFPGSKMGEGRIAGFTASGGGLIFSPNLKGYRITLLTGDRRVTLLGQSPEDEWKEIEPIVLAVARSMRR
jgi:predicted DNA-binding WGR domain protein